MNKQYIIEEPCNGETEINFFVDGSCVKTIIIPNYRLEGYTQAKEEDGWKRAYSHKEMQETISKIKSLKEDLSWWENQLEVIKNNLLKD